MTRLGLIVATTLAAVGIGYPGLSPMPTKPIWNATASAPVGFYTVERANQIEVPDLVAVLPPEPLARFMVARGYVGRGVPLLKHVLGLPGHRVCRTGRTITVATSARFPPRRSSAARSPSTPTPTTTAASSGAPQHVEGRIDTFHPSATEGDSHGQYRRIPEDQDRLFRQHSHASH